MLSFQSPEAPDVQVHSEISPEAMEQMVDVGHTVIGKYVDLSYLRDVMAEINVIPLHRTYNPGDRDRYHAYLDPSEAEHYPIAFGFMGKAVQAARTQLAPTLPSTEPSMFPHQPHSLTVQRFASEGIIGLHRDSDFTDVFVATVNIAGTGTAEVWLPSANESESPADYIYQLHPGDLSFYRTKIGQQDTVADFPPHRVTNTARDGSDRWIITAQSRIASSR